MLDRKRFTYFAFKKVLTLKDGDTAIMIGQLNTHNLYCVNISNNVLVTILFACNMTNATSLLPSNLAI